MITSKKSTMKKLYLFISLNILLFNLNAQVFEWAKNEGLWAYDYGYGISTDLAGNVYVAGKYELAAIFSGTTLTNQGNHDMYVAKYNSAGSLNWIRTAGGGLGDYAHAMTCDGAGNVYVGGEVEGYNTTVPFEGSPITVPCKGDNDAFIAKYDTNGDLLWAKSGGGNRNDKTLGVTYDNLGNIYICGMFTDTATFGGIALYAQGGLLNNKDIFVAKYDANGNFQWVRQGGSTGRDEALSVKCDASGNVYVCGFYSNGAVFGSHTLASPGPGGLYYNAFLAKYAPDGTLVWIKTAGGDYDEVAWSLTLDNSGKIYVTGEFNASANFDNIQLITTGNANIFVACYDPTTGDVLWAKGAGGKLIDRARGIGTDGTNIFITGQFGGDTATFGTFNLIGVDSSDIFMAGLNSSGDFVWATSVGGIHDAPEGLSYESGNAITGDTFGNIYATGALLDGGTFGTISVSKYGRTDAFISKISQVIISVPENNQFNEISIYPNPNNGVFDLKTDQPGELHTVQIYNVMGQKVYEAGNLQASSSLQIDLSLKEKGVYVVITTSKDQTVKRNKIIIQ